MSKPVHLAVQRLIGGAWPHAARAQGDIAMACDAYYKPKSPMTSEPSEVTCRRCRLTRAHREKVLPSE